MSTMEATAQTPQPPTASDIESRAARIADPTTSLKMRYESAVQLKEMMVDSVRDAEVYRAYAQMTAVLVNLLKTNEPSFKKDSQEYLFRKTLAEIMSRALQFEALRTSSGELMTTLLALLRTENEDIVPICMKAVVEIMRAQKSMSEEVVAEIIKFVKDLLANMPALIEEYLSDNSSTIEPSLVLPGIRSFKVLVDVPFVFIVILQLARSTALPIMNEMLNAALDAVLLESPAQTKERENYEAMGGIWSGMASAIVNPQLYQDLLVGQIKLSTFIAGLLRTSPDTFRQDNRGDKFASCLTRLLQDCPVQVVTQRKELLFVMRHLSGTQHRRALMSDFHKLLSDKVLFGGSVGIQEFMRPALYSVLAEIVSALREELNIEQLSLVIFTYSNIFFNHRLSLQIQIYGARLLFNMVEPVLKRDEHEKATNLLHYMLRMGTNKASALANIAEDLLVDFEAKKSGATGVDVASIEKERPVAGIAPSSDSMDDVMRDIRLMLRTVLFGGRACIGGLKKLNAPLPDGEVMLPLFKASVRILSLNDAREQREEKDMLEGFAGLLSDLHPHVLQEIWISEMDFFFNAVVKHSQLALVLQALFVHEHLSSALVSITLRHFANKLGELGSYDELHATVTIKFFKLCFNSVNLFPEANEPILASHLGRLIMDSFPLASKAESPTQYFQLMRALFRAIGSGAGKYEHLYREVLPLMPEMLDSLNRQLIASEGNNRELLVELCLTVPLRLTHLLPHLHYLMHPLVLALQGGTELVSQGLRTLELCIDNLIGDFLDPILRPVLRDLMEALHAHLRPLPANHQHAHTTIRILGKLGGRNRRLLDEAPHLEYSQYSDPATLSLSFSGRPEKIKAGPMALLAANLIQKPNFGDKVHAYNYLEHTLTILLNEGTHGQDREDVFVKGLEGLFDAIHIPEVQERAEAYLRTLSHHVFTLECRRAVVKSSKDIAVRRYPSQMFRLYMDALPHALVRSDSAQRSKALAFVESLIHAVVPVANELNLQHIDLMVLLHQLSGCFLALCYQEAWVRKEAGCAGIMMLISMPEIGEKWTVVRDIDLVRTLLHLLKDLPHDPPSNVSNILDILKRALRIAIKPSYPVDPNLPTPNKIPYLIGIFFTELSSAHPVVRKAVHSCLELISELSGKSIYDLLRPHRDRTMTALFTKPLRALPHPIIIGQIEAIRYCLCLNPPLPELTEELLRLLHETLALADMEDHQLVSRNNVRQSTIEATNLRVACIKLLTASLPLTDLFAKQSQTRSRVIAVYFKSLYSSSPEVKDVAHEGLKCVLAHQHRLPKDIMQSGLRPVLMNLADPKRLSVGGLEGLARLMKLLTSSFKVEIGSKLLDHFSVIASDPQVFSASSRTPITDNEAVAKIVRLVNIFHLLPSAANVYMNDLVNGVVRTEAALHSALPSPFSEPLGKFLDRYRTESVDYFLSNITSNGHVRTLRNVLLSGKAPMLQREFAARPADIARACFRSGDDSAILPGLLICTDIADLMPGWSTTCDSIIASLIGILRLDGNQEYDGPTEASLCAQRHDLIISFFIKALEESPRIDLLFELVTVYSRTLSLDLSTMTRFLYSHVALKGSLVFRRNILTRFLTWFDHSSVDWKTKTSFIRYIVNPILIAHAARLPEEVILDRSFSRFLHEKIWSRLCNKDDRTFADADDLFKVEILHLSIILVQHFSHLLSEAKKEIFRCAWIFHSHEDMVVRHTSFLLAARLQEVFESPVTFLMNSWQGLLKHPQPENRVLVRQALDILAGVLQKKASAETAVPVWAQTARRYLSEETPGATQVNLVYQLIVRQPELFYPYRANFAPMMVSSLQKLGLQGTSSQESRLLSLEAISVIFTWEQKSVPGGDPRTTWATPHTSRETMVSYLVRMAISIPENQGRAVIVPRALKLLGELLGSSGWSDVSFKWDFFGKPLNQTEMTTPPQLMQAVASAKVLAVVCADRADDWIANHATVLQGLIQKGLQTEDRSLLESLHPIFERLIHLYPLPKEDEETQDEMADFHKFIYRAISDGLKETGHRGALIMLKSVLAVTPERIEPFAAPLLRVLGRLAKEHTQSQPGTTDYDGLITLLISVFDICQDNPFLPAEQKKNLLASFNILIDKSNSPKLCEFLLDKARDWALNRKEAYPSMKDKSVMLGKMASFETRGEGLFNRYLELIYDIYTEPSLKRTDLTTRLENSFLIGCRARDTSLRERFIDLLDSSIPRSLTARLTYIFGIQSWEAVSEANWIHIALNLVLSSIDSDEPLVPALSSTFKQSGSPLAQTSLNTKAKDITRPMRRLFFYNPEAAHKTWVSLFSSIWTSLSRKEQNEMAQHLIVLLSKEYHLRQAEVRPNIIQTILEGIHACNPPISLPPHLVKYLAKSFGAWHVGFEYLQSCLDVSREEDSSTREMVYDSLAELYAELAEDDMFYGLWRRRCLHLESNVAISYEQNGMWQEAQIAYENAQQRAKNGFIPFSEPEYCLWEDHWILATEKLQQWDILYDLARSDGSFDLALESAWRNKDWSVKETRDSIEEMLQQMLEVATPRRRIYEAFLFLVKSPVAMERNADFTRILEDAMQLSLRKWVGLPPRMSAAHIPLLQNFQQLVELQEATQVFNSLATTTPQNLERKSSDLKMVLQSWRERLPNLHDDISVWSDLIAWRQNVFNAINKHYIPLIHNTPGNQSANNANSTFGYRGFHETAWIINRFAHVARKHDLLDVAQASLTKIYELPNIEISEAFLKLREEARCRLQVPEKLNDGLNLILNTNLMYFSTPQKAEFYSLKGMFYSALGQNEEADQYFGQAVQLDMGLPKAWAEWGRYNDKIFNEHPNDFSTGANAVSCYLQAAGLYKNTKSRPLLTRVLWLLSVDDASSTIAQAFDGHQGDFALWYWITLIPQLCSSLSHREARQARSILLAIAKQFPQALFFTLRSTREELNLAKKARNLQASVNGTSMANSAETAGSSTKIEDVVMGNTGTTSQTGPSSPSNSLRPDYEYVDELASILKTGYPLLALSLETMVDQFCTKFKASPEEEVYRFTLMMLQDAIQAYTMRVPIVNDDGSRPASIVRTVLGLAPHFAGQAKKDYEEDFLKDNPSLQQHIRRLQSWRDRYENFLDSRPRVQPLDLLSPWLVEYQYSKVEEIEVPGQYLEHLDGPSQFTRVRKFGSKFNLCRGQGYCYKRFVIYGHDGTQKTFAVQQPAARWCRREDCVMQLFRSFNHALTRRKESRKRNLHFHFPLAVSLSTSVRLLSNDPSYVSMQDIYDQHCEELGITREDPILMAGEKIKAVLRDSPNILNKTEHMNLKKSVIDELVTKMIPDDILTNYMTRTMNGPMELWRMRKAFTLQLSAVSFMTYIVCITSRQPSRFHISRTTGQIYMSELLPGTSTVSYVFSSNESVPFRFTPNMQQFVTPVGTEALLVPGMVAIARALTKPEYELDQHLCLFSREEVRGWRTPVNVDKPLREKVADNIQSVVQKADVMACKFERGQEPKDADKPVPAMQTVTNLVSMATNPLKLAMMHEWSTPWF